MSDPRAHAIYTKLLLRRGHGYPLWIPESDDNLPDVYRNKGVSVGDLGILTDDGGFDFLFNVCAEADDPVNQGHVPPQFQPLRISSSHAIRKIPFHRKNSSITSAHVSKMTIAVEGSAEMTCVNALPLPFSSSHSLIRYLLSARLSPAEADLNSALRRLKLLS